MEALEDQIACLCPDDTLSQEDIQAVQEYKGLEALRGKLSIFTTHMDETWIFQEQGEEGKPER